MEDDNNPIVPELPLRQKLPESTPVVPVGKKDSKKLLISLTIIITLIVSVLGTLIIIDTGLVDEYYVKTDFCINQSILAYQYGINDGIIQSANFTTITGNFTYIAEEQIQTMSVQDYCIDLFQNLNTQEVK